jgi:hypothetical protein
VEIEAAAKRRLADENDAAQPEERKLRGSTEKRSRRERFHSGDVGLTRKQVHEALFAVAVAFILAAIIALNHVDTRQASNASPPGTVGLAQPHPPLDIAPGMPVPPPQPK